VFTQAVVYDATVGAYYGTVRLGTGYTPIALPVGTPGHNLTPLKGSISIGTVSPSPNAVPITAFTGGAVYDATLGAFFGIQYTSKGYVRIALPVGIPGHDTTPVGESVGNIATGPNTNTTMPAFTAGVVYDATVGAFFGLTYTANGYVPFAVSVGPAGHKTMPISETIGNVQSNPRLPPVVGFTLAVVFDATAGAYYGVLLGPRGYVGFAVPVGTPGHNLTPVSQTAGFASTGLLTPQAVIFTSAVVYDATDGAYHGIGYINGRYIPFAGPLGTPGDDLSPVSNSVDVFSPGGLAAPRPVFTSGVVLDATSGVYLGLQYTTKGNSLFALPIGGAGHKLKSISSSVTLVPSGTLAPPKAVFNSGVIFDATAGAYYGIQLTNGVYTTFAVPVGPPGDQLTDVSATVGTVPG
jgi:hypothetical protein